MAHGCIIKGLQSGAERPLEKWSVRKRDDVWCVYAPGQCCPVAASWTHATAIVRAQRIMKGMCR